MGRHFLRLVVLLQLIGALALAVDIRLARSESATIVVPDDFPAIQEAIDSAVDGDTVFVKAGTYYEHIDVDKALSIVGEDVDTAIIDGSNTGHVIHVLCDNVSIQRLTVQNSGNIHWPALEAGICLNGTADCMVTENRLIGNGFAGISLLDSQRNTVTRNNVTGTGWGSIHMLTSSHNTISGNVLSSAYVGINGHASSHYNNVTENIISNCTYGMFYHSVNCNRICRNNISDIAVEGIELQDRVNYNVVAENNLKNCTVSIKLVGPNYNNTISGNFLTGGWSGIRVVNARYTEISNNTISHICGGEWDAGIRLDSAGYSRIHSNLIVNNRRGILLYTSSPYVSIYCNSITNNDFAIRVASGGSNYLNVSDNIIINNRGYGIGLTGFGSASNYATISRNLIANNSDGIALGQYSNYNTITHNNISRNGYGFHVEYSAQNTIWGNNIVENDQQAHVSGGSLNSWDLGCTTGGNHWSDHVCTGNPSDGSQAYVIGTDNIDHYPFQDADGWLLHHLTVTSSPIIGIAFTVNGTLQTTTYGEWLLEDSYTLQMPESHGEYMWSHWLEDGGTNSSKVAIMNTDITLTGVFYHLCDLDRSGSVDTKDIAVAALAFGSDPSHPRWNPNADINKDSLIDMKDVARTAKSFGKA